MFVIRKETLNYTETLAHTETLAQAQDKARELSVEALSDLLRQGIRAELRHGAGCRADFPISWADEPHGVTAYRIHSRGKQDVFTEIRIVRQLQKPISKARKEMNDE